MTKRNWQNENDDSNRAQVIANLIEATPHLALLLLDPDGKITFVNAGAEKLLGYPSAEVLGKHVSLLFTSDDVEAGIADKELERALENGSVDDERWHERKGGKRFWGAGFVTTLKEPGGNFIGFAKVLRDATAKKLLEEKLKSDCEELNRFGHAAAHDLKEPLRVLILYLQLTEKRLNEKSSNALEFLTIAKEHALRLQSLFESLLTTARLESKNVEPETFDFSELVDAATSNLKVLIDEKGATVTRSGLPNVFGVYDDLCRLLLNLISNAIKYARPEVAPVVSVDAREEDGHWEISVKDNGVGINPDKKADVFKPFFRLHSRTEVDGAGLGLFLCRKIVERHGGRIWHESTPGVGTTVLFTLRKAWDDDNQEMI